MGRQAGGREDRHPCQVVPMVPREKKIPQTVTCSVSCPKPSKSPCPGTCTELGCGCPRLREPRPLLSAGAPPGPLRLPQPCPRAWVGVCVTWVPGGATLELLGALSGLFGLPCPVPAPCTPPPGRHPWDPSASCSPDLRSPVHSRPQSLFSFDRCPGHTCLCPTWRPPPSSSSPPFSPSCPPLALRTQLPMGPT